MNEVPKLTLVIDRLLYRPRTDAAPLSLVDEAILGGVSLIQMRLSAATGSADTLETYAVAQRLREITTGRVPLVVTDDLDLAEKCHADGILLSTELTYRPDSVRDFIRTESNLVGCFVTSVRASARAERGGADYVQVGPVFGGALDSDGDEGLLLLRKVRDAIHLPVVAFGGISSLDLARQAIDAGANGIAVTDAILTADNPRAAAAEYAALLG